MHTNDPKLSFTFFQMGDGSADGLDVINNLGEYRRAIEDLDKALRLDPGLALAYIDYATAPSDASEDIADIAVRVILSPMFSRFVESRRFRLPPKNIRSIPARRNFRTKPSRCSSPPPALRNCDTSRPGGAGTSGQVSSGRPTIPWGSSSSPLHRAHHVDVTKPDAVIRGRCQSP
jgi:hypothetical protein